MTKLQEFLLANDLKQKDLVDYLKLSKGAVSNAVRGTANLGDMQTLKLIHNPYGWDTSMLEGGSNQDTMIVQTVRDNYGNLTGRSGSDKTAAVEVELLRSLLEEKDRVIRMQQEMIEMLRNK